MYRFCLNRQINEVEILKSVFCGDGELRVWNEEQYEKLKHDLKGGGEDDEIPQVELQLNLPLEPPYPSDANVMIDVTMLPFYPSSDGADVKIRVPRKILPESKERVLNDEAAKFVASKLGQECVLDLVQFVKDQIYDNSPPPSPSSAKREPSNGSSKGLMKPSSPPSPAPSPPPTILTPKEQEFRRILVWFSTIAPDRAKTVADWAKQLGLTGLSRLGSPALLLVEGIKADVDEYVSSLRSYRWKKMDIVWEDKTRCSNVNDCRRFQHFQEIMLPLQELQPIFKNAGLEEMYKEGLKIRG